MKLTTITPCYQERRFIIGFLENCLTYADEVIISEGGSTDGTREIISDYSVAHPGWLRVVEYPQSDQPQRDMWAEGVRRQAITDMVKEGLIVLCDVDEMLSDNFREVVTTLLPEGHAGQVECLAFWRSPGYIRIAAKDDEHWGPIWKTMVYPAGILRWEDRANEAHILTKMPNVRLLGVNKLHYHYLYANRKCYENRILEALGQELPEIKLARWIGKHPAALKHLAPERIEWFKLNGGE